MSDRFASSLAALPASFPAHAHRRPLVLAVRAALIGSMALSAPFAMQAMAADATVATATAQRYDIPAGPLNLSLYAFASHAGVTLSFDPAMVDGMQAPALRGNFGVQDGLARLLSGSGVEAVAGSNGGYRLRRVVNTASAPSATQSASAVLPEVTVTAAGVRDGATEGSGSYTTRSMASATKLPLSIRETPQAVTVLTRQQMDDQAMSSLNDVAQNAPGVFLSFSGGINRPGYSARGFDIETVMYDGFPSAVHGYIPSSQANLAMYDRVEVVRGATGLVQGAGNPSAAINLVRKRPGRETQASITATAGSWQNLGLVADVGGPLNDAGTLRARVVASGQDADNFREAEEEKRGLFYAVAEADLGDKTTLALGAFRQRDATNLIWGGLPNAADGAHLGLPRSTFIGADWEHSKSANTGTFATLEHRFDNDWQLRGGLHHTTSKVDLLATSVWDNDRYLWAERMDHKEAGVDINVSGPFEWLGRRHELVGGVSYRRMDYTTYDDAFQYMNPVDPMTWRPRGTPKPLYAVNPERGTDVTTQESTYLAGRFSLSEGLKLVLGGRLDWYDHDSRDSEGDYRISRRATRYAGLLYDLDAHHTLYASYTDIFRPQTERDMGRKLLSPITGKNHEVGLKGEYFGGALNTSVALFRIDQANRARALDDQSGCPVYPASQCYEAAGLVRSKGIDLEVQGALTPNWQLGAGFTYSHTRYIEDADPARIGTTFNTAIPRQLFKLSTLYRLPGELNQWRVGGNLHQQSKISAGNGSDWYNEQKSHAIAGLLVGYRVNNQLDLQLNVNNVFDKTYYRSISSGVWYPYDMYGTPRSFLLTARYTF